MMGVACDSLRGESTFYAQAQMCARTAHGCLLQLLFVRNACENEFLLMSTHVQNMCMSTNYKNTKTRAEHETTPITPSTDLFFLL